MAIVEKPRAVSWTEANHLGTGLVSYEDSFSPEFFEAEREAIFKRCWLNVGRVEQVPRAGSYFTKELAVGNTSIIVVRGADGTIRAFHNMCRHRGNKLVWTDHPGAEECGSCRQFSCKYHGWRYGIDGQLNHITQEEDFFNIDKSDFGLVEVNLDVWEGFIFVNLNRTPPQPLRDFLGDMAAAIEGYPFERMTQVYRYRAEVGANWKLFMDAFAEFYHVVSLHANLIASPEIRKMAQDLGGHALSYRVYGPHRVFTAPSAAPPDLPPEAVEQLVLLGSKPVEQLTRGGLFGPWDKPDIGITELPPGINPMRSPAWGLDSFQFFPNFVILIWEQNWYLTYHYWPLTADSNLFEGTLYFVPPKNAAERLAQEMTAVTFKEYGLQDANTLEATHTMLKSRVVDQFPLSDEEVLVRHLHQEVQDWVKAYRS